MSSFDCVCDYDPPDVYRQQIRKARKPHKCYECGGAIAIGEKYESVWAIANGQVYAPNTCERCCDIRTWVKNNVPCFCWLHGSMLDDAKEAVNEAQFRAPGETAGLYFGLLRRIVKLRQHNHKRKP